MAQTCSFKSAGFQRVTASESRGSGYQAKTTEYFKAIRSRLDRRIITGEWIEQVMANPIAEKVQQDGRIRRWGRVPEMDNRVLRVVLLPDRDTVHNAFFDRTFREKSK